MRAKGSEAPRRILCVFPRYTSAFGTFEHAYPLTDGVSAFMPPQGLLLIAAYLPENWPVRFIDEGVGRLRRTPSVDPPTARVYGSNL